MEKKLYEMQAELCKTLSNPKRLEILDILKEREEISVNNLAEILEIPKANTSQHLAVLRQSGVVNTRLDAEKVWPRKGPGNREQAYSQAVTDRSNKANNY